VSEAGSGRIETAHADEAVDLSAKHVWATAGVARVQAHAHFTMWSAIGHGHALDVERR
jgi:hypothetical protein